MAKLKLSETYKHISIDKPVKKAWNELTELQQQDAAKQLHFAGWKDAKEYGCITFMVKSDGSIYGWNDPKFYI